MRLYHLFEDISHQKLVIFPGRFQPVTRNHFNVYKYLCKTFGQQNVFIASSNKTEAPKSPFTFEEKKALLSFIGVEPSHIVETKSPYIAREITEHYDPASTVLIFAVGQKDMEEDPRFNFKPKKDGNPSYFQPYEPNKNNLQTFDKHAYITPIPNFKFELNGQQILGATQIRAMFAEADVQQQKHLFKELYGKFDPKLFSIVSNKLSGKVAEGIKDSLKKVGAGASIAMAAFGANPHHPLNPEVPVNPLYFRYKDAERRESLRRNRENNLKSSNNITSRKYDI